MKLKFTVGQQLLYRPKNHRGEYQEPHAVTIEKVGTKWLTIVGAKRQASRVSRFTMQVDWGGFNIGECYLDRDDFDTRAAREQAYEELRRRMPYRLPVGMSMNDINTIRDRLGL